MNPISLQIQPNVTIEARRCYLCGSYYGTEKDRGISNANCPFCLARDLQKSVERLRELDRSNNALRGVISRMKKAIQ